MDSYNSTERERERENESCVQTVHYTGLKSTQFLETDFQKTQQSSLFWYFTMWSQ